MVAGIYIGYALSARPAPVPKEPALLWDDYILAVASLYQRDGDLAAAKERLRRLSTDDPGASVAALAAIYVPDGRYGEGQASALHDLAVALTGRAVPTPAIAVRSSAAPEAGPADALGSLAHNQFFWFFVLAVSLAVVGTSLIRYRRPAAVAANLGSGSQRALGPAGTSVLPASAVKRPRPSRTPSAPAVVAMPRATAAIRQTFVFEGGDDPLETMAPVTDPVTGRLVAGCGMTNGPRAGGANGGYVGFLVWLHEMGSREMPQTLGLLAEGAGEACKAAVAEWADYARVDELVEARPGVVRTFETGRLRAAVSVVDLAQTRSGRSKHKVFRRLEVELEIAFKGNGRLATAASD